VRNVFKTLVYKTLTFFKARSYSLAFFSVLISFFGLLFSQSAIANVPPDIDVAIKRFVARNPMVAGMQTEVEYIDQNPTIQACPEKIEVGSQPGIRLWGRTSVQLRCRKLAWTYNLAIRVRVIGDYVVAGRYLQGNVKVAQGDLRVVQGDLTDLTDDVLRSVKDGYNRILVRPVQAGMPIGLNDLREPAVIAIGDPVRILISGKDFEVTGEGVAQTSGMVGDTVKVKLYDGQTISGKILRAGVVVVNTQ
jgi:flagella basal body P-ring formation protein FlgA